MLCRLHRGLAARVKTRPALSLSNSTHIPLSALEDIVLVPGKATTGATKAFVARAKLPLYHTFNQSKLTINPVIMGPAKGFDGEDEYINKCVRKCLLENQVSPKTGNPKPDIT